MAKFDFSMVDDAPGNRTSCLGQLRRWRRKFREAPFADFLTEHRIDLGELLIELATTDLIHQSACGLRVRAEDYLSASDLLAGCDEFVLDLVDAELCARSDRGETVEGLELAQRFPKLQWELARLLEVHRLDLQSSADRSAAWNSSDEVRLIGRYRLSQPISRRDCKYWLAETLPTGSPAVVFWYLLPDLVTQLPPDAASQFREQLLQVLRKRSDCQHPALQPVVGWDLVGDQIVVAFKPIGPAQLVRDKAVRLSEEAAARLLLELTELRQFEATSGRPLFQFSPNDIFIDTDFSCRLLDWGLGNWVQRLAAVYAEHVPAIAKQELRISTADTLQELGMLLFSLMLPEAETDDVVQHLQHGFEPLKIRQIDESVSSAYDAIYWACVHPDKKYRYPSVEALIEDLRRFVAGESVRVGRRQRRPFWRWK